jgi:zona occludens toxin (predicted ATPase)
MRSIIAYQLPFSETYYLRRSFSSLIKECDADDRLTTKGLWRQSNIKIAIVILFLFYSFSTYAATNRTATTVYNESHLY